MLPKRIGELVRQRRKAAHMTIETLAEKSGTSVAFISRLELHTSGSVRLDKVYQVLDVLKLSPSEVFGQLEMDDSEAALWTALHRLSDRDRREKIDAILKLLA